MLKRKYTEFKLSGNYLRKYFQINLKNKENTLHKRSDVYFFKIFV